MNIPIDSNGKVIEIRALTSSKRTLYQGLPFQSYVLPDPLRGPDTSQKAPDTSQKAPDTVQLLMPIEVMHNVTINFEYEQLISLIRFENEQWPIHVAAKP